MSAPRVYTPIVCMGCGEWTERTSPRQKRCSACSREVALERNRKYREENPEAERERNRELCRKYYEENREAERERKRRYHEENREAERERCRRYHEENREADRERRRRYHEKNREAERERKRKYYEENPEAERERRRKSREKNRVTACVAAHHRGPWTPEEDERLLALVREGVTIFEIALELGRTMSACRSRQVRLKA